jgi:hypothetical protein
MDEKPMHPDADLGPDAIEGADAAALGTAAPPESAPPGADVDPTDRLAGLTPAEAATPPSTPRPWATTLAARGPDAGVMVDEPVAEEPDPAFDEDEHRR